ncbi:MAG: YggS family pyridoxal phosphate-dependent enzyme [Phycisphaerae bacterium]|nr:YggS family pyridoxal phosphate-dependent enzyme [Phycisphaerae bacterium]HJN70977.1 YggS family pyridoxal phosphate-dependent enzyme [Phycisphaerales bacterium]
MTTIKQRYESVKLRIADAAIRSNRKPEDIHLVAVTKHASMDEVRQLLEIGHVDFGESRVQHFTQLDAQVKEHIDRRSEIGELKQTEPVRWHFIGHLQRNKCRRVLPLARLVQSLDSLRLAEEIQESAEKKQLTVEVLVQVNVSGERNKSGVAPAAVTHILDQIDTMPNVVPRGMMCMAPFFEDAEETRPIFTRCREIFEDLKISPNVGSRFNVLSMGMSNDFEVAIECGANIVRVGTALFGEVDEVSDDSTAECAKS